MKKRKKVIATVILLLSLLGCSSQQNETDTEKTISFFAMDTYIELTASGENADASLATAQKRIEELEHLWSVTDKKSEIYALNHSKGQSLLLSDDTAALLSFALKVAQKTNGALEPTIYPVLAAWGFTTEERNIPSEQEMAQSMELVGYKNVELIGNTAALPIGMQVDLGAVGKGYASDEVAEILRENEINSALLDVGGSVQMIGKKPDGSDWKIGLKNPLSDGNLGVLSISDCAVVTSGNYERYFIGEDGKRYGHIIDPATGHPTENELASVTVIAKNAKLCDGLSTALFVMGLENARDYWKKHQDFDMILIMENGEIHLTEGIKNNFSLSEESKNTKINVINL